MELIRTNRDTQLTTARQEPWALAIREQYGDLPTFAAKFSIQQQKYCARNMVKAVENNLPTLARIIGTYGEEGVSGIINTHITDAILRMGEDRDVDPADVQFIAEAICEGDRFRILRWPTILGFFHLLKCGEFDIYGKVTPRKVLEAFRKYAIDAKAKENRIAYEKEQRDRREEERRHDEQIRREREARARKGLPPLPADPVAAALADCEKEQERKKAPALLAEALRQLIFIIEVIDDWKRKNGPGRPQTAPGTRRQ